MNMIEVEKTIQESKFHAERAVFYANRSRKLLTMAIVLGCIALALLFIFSAKGEPTNASVQLYITSAVISSNPPTMILEISTNEWKTSKTIAIPVVITNICPTNFNFEYPQRYVWIIKNSAD